MKKYRIYYELQGPTVTHDFTYDFETDGDQFVFAMNWKVNECPAAKILGVYERTWE